MLGQPRTGRALALSPSGLAIWELLASPSTLADVCLGLEAEFSVPRGALEGEVLAFAEDLYRRDLIAVWRQRDEASRWRGRYLDLLAKALANLIYPEHELRIRWLQEGPGEGDALARDRMLRDIRYQLPEEYQELIHHKENGTVLRHQMTRYSHTAIGMKRLVNLRHCADRVFREGIPGDFLEAGVCQGGASIFLRALQVACGESARTTWVADSFQGMPAPEAPPDLEARLDWREPQQPWLAHGRRAVEDHFRTYGLLDAQVRFLEGWFSETLAAAPVERLSILRIDADLYQSTWEVLEALYDKVEPGGFVIIDDYGALGACRLAVDSFRAARGLAEPIQWIDWSGIFWRKTL